MKPDSNFHDINPPARSTHSPLHSSHWLPRLLTCGIMLLLALAGLIYTDINPENGWNFWRIAVIAYAILSILLSAYLNHKTPHFRKVSIRHEILHWISLLLSVYLVTILVDVGLLGRMPAGLVVVILLAFSTLVAGIYIDRCFLLIGATLAIFVVSAALVEAYLSLVMVPVVILVAVALIWLVRHYDDHGLL